MILKPHILIVEDNYLLYENMKNLLLEQGYNVDKFTPSYDEAISRINMQRPDLVLLDIQLKGDKNGLNLGLKLQGEYSIPFIYVTELDDRRTFNFALQTGHDIFMVKTKPVLDENMLLRNIETVLNRVNSPTTNSSNDTIGIIGLVDYLDEIKNQRFTEISRVPVLFSDIDFFSIDDFIDENGEKQAIRINYSWVLTQKGDFYFVKKSLKQILEITPNNFVRINGRYIINLHSENIKGKTSQNRIQIGDRILEITSTYKSEYLKRISSLYGK